MTPVNLFIWFAGTVLLTLSGPFGTFESLPYAPRALFWLGVIMTSLVVSNTVRIVADKVASRFNQVAAQYIFASLITLVLTPLIFALAYWVDNLSAKSEVDPDPVRMLFYVATVSFAIGTARLLFHFQQVQMPRLLERLPESTIGNMIRLTSKDHYVEIVTDKGSEQIRMRFADALGELDGIAGAQVHRSHWVASKAVEAAERENGRVYLRLVDGSRIPVSRGYIENARAAGLMRTEAA